MKKVDVFWRRPPKNKKLEEIFVILASWKR